MGAKYRFGETKYMLQIRCSIDEHHICSFILFKPNQAVEVYK